MDRHRVLKNPTSRPLVGGIAYQIEQSGLTRTILLRNYSQCRGMKEQIFYFS
jgi:hypothetical protein